MLRVYDEFLEDETVLSLSHKAYRLHMSALIYCSKNLTDGAVSKRAVKVLRAILEFPVTGCVTELADAGLWIETKDGYEIRNFLKFNPSAEEVKTLRESNRRRVSLSRNQTLRDAVRDRDGDCCRYCGVAVRWADRRGPLGGTYDHVDPNRGNELDNLVVSCRACNSVKGRRTPAKAGMELRSVSRSVSKSVIKSDLDQGDLDPTQVPHARALPKPLPKPLVSKVHAPTSFEGRETLDENLWRRLCAAAGARTLPDVRKLERTIAARRCGDREVVCAIEAATGPGVRDPLAVALSELVKRAGERAA